MGTVTVRLKSTDAEPAAALALPHALSGSWISTEESMSYCSVRGPRDSGWLSVLLQVSYLFLVPSLYASAYWRSLHRVPAVEILTPSLYLEVLTVGGRILTCMHSLSDPHCPFPCFCSWVSISSVHSWWGSWSTHNGPSSWFFLSWVIEHL